jgi:3-methyl-2-oxobutanoate hydroxymethyltransferase
MSEPKKISSLVLRQRKEQPGAGKIVALTAYDYTSAKLVDELVDVLLVGDSLGMVIQGEPNTLSVRLEDVLYHTRAVARAIKHAHLVADMPFMSYQTSVKSAIQSAGRLLAEGHAEAVKVEGGVTIAATVAKLVQLGIPVMGHIGLTPQSVHAFGGYKIQGKTDRARESILADALALEDAGAYSLVLEGVPADLGRLITERVKIPTIGIGAGQYCDGQVLVFHDVLGLDPDFHPRFVKQYAQLAGQVREAVKQYAREVQEGTFPDANHSF